MKNDSDSGDLRANVRPICRPPARRHEVRYVRLDDRHTEAGTTGEADATAAEEADPVGGTDSPRVRGMRGSSEPAKATLKTPLRMEGHNCRRRPGSHHITKDAVRSSTFREGWYESRAYARQVERERALVDSFRSRIDVIVRMPLIDEALSAASELPVEVSRACLAQPRDRDPLWPLACRLWSFLGSMSLDLAGVLYGLSRERIRQIECVALAKCVGPMHGWDEYASSDDDHTWPEAFS